MPTTKHIIACPENPPEQLKFIPAKTAAAILNVHPKTILRYADSGLIHRYKLNARVVLFNEAELLAFIKATRIN